MIGDVTCKGIVIDENAVFQGKCDMIGVDKSSAEIAKERAAANKDSDSTAESSEDSNKSEGPDSSSEASKESSDSSSESK